MGDIFERKFFIRIWLTKKGQKGKCDFVGSMLQAFSFPEKERVGH
jgi:hypothetical protein